MGCVSVDNERLYELLGLKKTDSRSEIRKAHQRLARVHHPDRGGDPEKFKEIQYAYEILSDDDKRAKYDRLGESGLEKPDLTSGGADFFDLLRGYNGAKEKRRQKTENVVSPLKVTLEQLYSGAAKKMAVNRQVVDKGEGMGSCQKCNGQGVTVESINLGGMLQHMQSSCKACNGSGKLFKHRREREVLEVHIQKGAQDGHKIVFREKADELPDADTGDVVFVLCQQQHPEFQRRGADLFIERKLSLVEALCGFEIEVTHLDGRKLLVKSSPGEVIRPMPHGFDPLAEGSEDKWECFDGFDCPEIETVAKANETDVKLLQEACKTQLTRRGLEVGAFMVDATGAHFKCCSHTEAHAAKRPRPGCKLYIKADPMASQQYRMLKAVKGEGMPTFKNPFLYGNLFLILTIEFPSSLPGESLEALKKILPPPLNSASAKEDDVGVETHTLVDLDPESSKAANKANMQSSSEAYNEDDRPLHGQSFPGHEGAQCHQM